ncbi:hypothetical protein L596_010959 [Steinernema carpocapsae]|uniref:Uncharacterized protein n=1 Tax=Steinernema carpocapsae TaxID=34508 RepID=A0A4U5NTB7_STECR|nr:hypothetical protein L596_010959 [Steinernema carpocapsae]
MQQAGQELQSKWISLQTIPQRVANASQQFVGSLQQAVGQGFNQQAQRLNQGNPLAFGYHNNQQENRILMQGQDNYQYSSQRARSRWVLSTSVSKTETTNTRIMVYSTNLLQMDNSSKAFPKRSTTRITCAHLIPAISRSNDTATV